MLKSEDLADKHLLNIIALFYAMRRKAHYLPKLESEAKRRDLPLPDPRTC
jgi:hypothetical protein